MDYRIHNLPLDKIILDSHIEIAEAYLQRMSSVKNEIYDVLLAVERHPDLADYYLLVGGFDKYRHLSATNQEYAPCLIEECSDNSVNREFKKLTRLFSKGDTKKANKLFIIARLKSLKIPFEVIAKKMALSFNEFIKNYEFNHDIPSYLITKDSTEKTLNWISSLPVDHCVKVFMYTRAGLGKTNCERLCQDNIKIITKFMEQEPRFRRLKPDHQIKILTAAISYKNISIAVNSLRKIMNELIAF